MDGLDQVIIISKPQAHASLNTFDYVKFDISEDLKRSFEGLATGHKNKFQGQVLQDQMAAGRFVLPVGECGFHLTEGQAARDGRASGLQVKKRPTSIAGQSTILGVHSPLKPGYLQQPHLSGLPPQACSVQSEPLQISATQAVPRICALQCPTDWLVL